MSPTRFPARGNVFPSSTAPARAPELAPRLLRTDVARSKLVPPRARSAVVARPRLLDKLDAEAHQARLVLIHAPAGYGKTTLMCQWADHLSRLGEATAWLTLDAGDNEPGHLLDALRHLLAPWCAGETDVLDLAASLAARPGRHTLFVDELEALNQEPALLVLRLLLERCPPNLRLVFGSRGAPDIGLGRLRAQGELLELTSEHLRFESDEAADLIAARSGSPLGARALRHLLRLTEGWAAALQLSALALRDRRNGEHYVRSLAGSNAEIAQFLAEDVLSKQPEEVREFLLATGVAQRLTPELCDCLSERNDSAEMLERLGRAQLFLQPEGDQGAWRYHPLFAEFLRRELALRRPEKLRELYRRAAAWHADHGENTAAVDFELRAGEFEGAAARMQACSRELMRQAELARLTGWMEQLPRHVWMSYPQLLVASAWGWGFRRQYELAAEALAILHERHGASGGHSAEAALASVVLNALQDHVGAAYAAAWPLRDHIDQMPPFEAGALATLLGYCLMLAGRFAEARHYLDRGIALHEDAGSQYGLSYGVCFTGMIAASRGELARAADHYLLMGNIAWRDTGPELREPENVLSLAVGLLPPVWYEQNRLDEARDYLERFLPLATARQSVDALILGYLTRARLLLAAGCEAEAIACLAEGETARYPHISDRLRQAMRWERVRMHLVLGEVARARTLAAELAPMRSAAAADGFVLPAEELEGLGIETARLLLHSGRATEAVALLRQALRPAEASERRWRLLRLRILLALALARDGERQLALEQLGAALQLGADMGAQRSFIDEGASLTELLVAIPARSLKPTAQALLQRLLAACGAPAAPTVELSPREREILRLLALGHSNEDLSARLHLSVHTVKWHVRRIFEKLGVHNRSRAAFVARELGLVAEEPPQGDSAAHR